ncbi:hypothetical protein [Actinoplanes sp. NPDC049265]|uniref:hypothetical protein n=1 Tax=Actinoplanes sp. NPDC049265 TaxID=3363902 RepID=UPI003717B0B3
MAADNPSKTTRWWPWVLAAVGAASVGFAAWRKCINDESGTVSVFAILGVILLACPFVLPRLEGFAVGPRKFELRLVQQIADQGAVNTAKLLDHSELARLAESYDVVHRELRGDNHRKSRIHVQDELVRRAAGFAAQHEFDPGEVRKLFPKALPAVRVLVVGLMQGDPRLLDGQTLALSIRAPASHNEQFQALVAVRMYWAHFTTADRLLLLCSIDGANIELGTNRSAEVDRIKRLTTFSVRPSRRRFWRRPSVH